MSSECIDKEYFLWISNVASYVGQNKWDIVTPFETLWKKIDKLGYNQAMALMEETILHHNIHIQTLVDQKEKIKIDVENKLLTKRQGALALNKIEKELEPLNKKLHTLQNSVDEVVLSKHDKLKKEFGDELITTLHDSSISLDKKKESLKQFVESKTQTLTGQNLDKHSKSEFVDDINSLINKQHGTEKELSAIEQFEQQYNCKLDVSQQFIKKCIHTYKTDTHNVKWYICGKMDGINHLDNYVVEVKNRTKSFFSTLRDYEKTQIQLYMLMIDFDQAKLVEKFKSKIRVTDVLRDQEYIDEIIAKLKIFIEGMTHFVSVNSEDKKNFLMSQEKEKFLHNLFLDNVMKYHHKHKHLELVKSKLNEKSKSVTCLIEDSEDSMSDELD
jgi:hypothetical protein